MFISLKSLLRLPVYTESGIHLGHIKDGELDVGTHHLRQYTVASHFFSKEYYLITPAQIKTITLEKIIVEDNISKIIAVEEKKGNPASATLGGAASMSKDL